METEIQYRLASEFSSEEITVFKKIVMEAGEVSPDTFDSLILKQPRLLFVGNTSNPVGVGALKVPNDSYKKRVFASAGSSYDSADFDVELGWVVSRQSGKGSRMAALLAEGTRLYATVREENLHMQHLLEKNGFRQSGNHYLSKDRKYYLLLFVKL